MAIFRKVHVSFWSDSFISELDQQQKLFYIYLLTNERTKQCGVYEITKRQISFDLGYSIPTVSKLLKYFISIDKILFSDKTNEIAIKNWAKYNYSSSPKVKSCINKELKDVKDTVLIEYLNGIHTLSQEEQEEEQEEEQNSTPPEIPFKTRKENFIKWFNDCKLKYNGKQGSFKVLSTTDENNLKTLFKGYDNKDFSIAVQNLYKDAWARENDMFTISHFLRVDNFNKYLSKGDSKKTINHSNPVN